MLGLEAVDAALLGLLGLMVGSFLNVVIHRLPKMMELRWAAECAGTAGGTQPVKCLPQSQPLQPDGAPLALPALRAPDPLV